MFWNFLPRSVLYRICYQYFLPQRFQMWLFRLLCFNKLFFQTDVLITYIISTTYNWKNQYHSYNWYYPKCILRSCNNFHKGFFSINSAFIVILEYKLSGQSCKNMTKIEWDKSRMFYQVKVAIAIAISCKMLKIGNTSPRLYLRSCICFLRGLPMCVIKCTCSNNQHVHIYYKWRIE